MPSQLGFAILIVTPKPGYALGVLAVTTNYQFSQLASGSNDPRPSFSISRRTCNLLASVAATPRKAQTSPRKYRA